MAANNLQKNYGHLTLRQLNMWQSTCVRCDFAHQLDQRGYGSLQPFLLFKIFVSPQNSWCSSLFMDIHPPNRRNRSSKSMIFLNMFNVLKTASHPHLHNSQHFTVHPQMSVWTSGLLEGFYMDIQCNGRMETDAETASPLDLTVCRLPCFVLIHQSMGRWMFISTLHGKRRVLVTTCRNKQNRVFSQQQTGWTIQVYPRGMKKKSRNWHA